MSEPNDVLELAAIIRTLPHGDYREGAAAEAEAILDSDWGRQHTRLVSENAALRERVEALEARGKQLDAECKSWIQTLADVETAWEEACAERDRLVELLVKVLPEHAVCPDDGPFVSFDEDGCCKTCGAVVTYADTRAALAAHEPQGGSADG